jgi:hypothetical protein
MIAITIAATVSFAFIRVPEYVPHLKSMDGGLNTSATQAYKNNLNAVA